MIRNNEQWLIPHGIYTPTFLCAYKTKSEYRLFIQKRLLVIWPSDNLSKYALEKLIVSTKCTYSHRLTSLKNVFLLQVYLKKHYLFDIALPPFSHPS